MNDLKRYFVTPYVLALMITSIHSLVMLFIEGVNSAWLGSLVAVLPGALFFGRVMRGTVARTTDHVPRMWGFAILGLALTVMLPSGSMIPSVYAFLVGVVGGLAYDFWYSRLGDRQNSQLVVGQVLPDFNLYTADGRLVTAEHIRQTPALLMFYRGNWCPLCMAQIKEVASQYQELNRRGVQVYLISNQSEQNSEQLAQKYDVNMNFMVDRDGVAGKALAIDHTGGTPVGVAGYDLDTTMPTVVMTNQQGIIIFADLTDNYRVRPEPETFLSVLDQNGVTA